MKLLLCISSFLVFGMMSIAQNPAINDLSWLTGNWTAIKNKPGKLRTERWEPAVTGRMQGYGIVVQGRDTTFMEKMHIEDKDGTLYFVAEVPENKKPVFFKVITMSKDGFECENPDHDFPKKITYQKRSDTLTVNISGNGNSVDFIFTRTP
ncbi:MAG: hypothetical protein EOO01_41020 [Chitinophagaceae bacterium]|nr:MAG: hypothetical protein EOO01_41020 [Chitinophagaceae bacterium]